MCAKECGLKIPLQCFGVTIRTWRRSIPDFEDIDLIILHNSHVIKRKAAPPPNPRTLHRAKWSERRGYKTEDQNNKFQVPTRSTLRHMVDRGTVTLVFLIFFSFNINIVYCEISELCEDVVQDEHWKTINAICTTLKKRSRNIRRHTYDTKM